MVIWFHNFGTGFWDEDNNRFIFQIEILDDAEHVNSVDTFYQHSTSIKLSQNLETLLESEKHSDVILLVGGKKLKAHKNILAARSPVFAAMFEHECKETEESCVDIVDVDLDVFQELLRYIYTGKVDVLKQYAAELLIASDKV